jgi:asparagine synthase (glutamine-hydrolysing)
MDTYLLDLINRVDKMSMANSMEMRSPFLSRELVDAVRTIDTKFFVGPTFSKKKISRNVKKLLKEVSCEAFGEEFTFRPKMGWPLPLKYFFMDDTMHQYIEKQLIPQMRARAVVNTLQVEKLWDNLASLSAVEVETFWISIAFEIWAGIFLDKRAILD